MWSDRPFVWILTPGAAEPQPFRFVDDGGPVNLGTPAQRMHLHFAWDEADQLHLVSGTDAAIAILDQTVGGLLEGMLEATIGDEQMDLMPRDRPVTFAWWREIIGEDSIPEFSGQVGFRRIPGGGE